MKRITGILIMALILSSLSGIAAVPLLRLGADNTNGNTGSVKELKITPGPNASLAAINSGVTLGPLAEQDASGAITIDNHPAMQFNKFTLTAWLRLASFGYDGNGVCLYDKLDPVSGKGLQLNLSFGAKQDLRVYAVIEKEAQYSKFFAGKIISGINGEWFFLAVSFDGFNLTAYKGTPDGKLEMATPVKLAAATPANLSNERPAIIGFRQTTGNRALKGSVADLRIYDTILAPGEIRGIMNEKKFAVAAKSLLPTVLMIGDSIRMGYAPLVKTALEGKAEILWPAENCEDSKHIRESLDAYLRNRKPDLVFFNCGLHDIKTDRVGGVKQISPGDYEKNLNAIVAYFKNRNIKAVFVSTTPVISEWHNQIQAFDRNDADVVSYNVIASRVMSQNGVKIIDLYPVIKNSNRDSVFRQDGVHFLPSGSEKLAQAIIPVIKEEITLRSPAFQ